MINYENATFESITDSIRILEDKKESLEIRKGLSQYIPGKVEEIELELKEVNSLIEELYEILKGEQYEIRGRNN